MTASHLAGGVLKRCVLCGLVALAGCAIPYKVELTETGAPRYRSAEIVYELRASQGALAAEALEPTRVVKHTGRARTNGKNNGWSAAAMRIQYPHPDGGTDRALVTLQLAAQSAAETRQTPPDGKRFPTGAVRLVTLRRKEEQSSERATSSQEQVIKVDIPKVELDLLLIDLANTGFFDGQQRSSSGTRLSVKIDRGETAGAWTPEPRLDDLLTRVYATAYRRPVIAERIEPDFGAGWTY